MKITDLINEDVAKIMSEETLIAIQEAFDKKVELTTEAALEAQDELYAEKLDQLIKTIDRDHSVKMKRVVSAIDQDRTQKLVKVIKKYETALNEGSKGTVSQVVGAVSTYLDTFLEESFSKEDFAKAVKNNTAMNVLASLRKTLAVDSVMMRESAQEAVLDGKSKMDVLQLENADLKHKLTLLEESFNAVRVNALIEEKISKMADDKKTFVRKTLKDKSLEFITENFEYVSRLFDKKEKEKIKSITEDAKKRKIDVDFIPEQQKVVVESLNNNNDNDAYDPYVSELDKVFGKR